VALADEVDARVRKAAQAIDAPTTDAPTTDPSTEPPQ
jgi:hypothetical protein